MSSSPETSLFDRNFKAFEEHYPVVAQFLEGLPAPLSKRVEANGRPENINLGEGMLYPEPAPDWAAKQIDAYFEDPDRVGFSTPDHCNLSRVSKGVLAKIADYFTEHHDNKLENFPVVDVGFSFIFGIGLGYHLPDLVKRNLSRYMVLVEPVPEFLLHAMATIDFSELFEHARENGTQIEFLLGKEPDEAIRILEKYLFVKRQTFLDGSYAFMHYHSWPLRETRRLLNEKIKSFFLSWGYFEDEILMMSNTYANLRQWDLSLITRKRYREQDVPVFIVGSGPSLDMALPVIKKYQDRAIIFSCGTSIGILLKNGIRPDFHVENENTLPLVDNLRGFSEEYGFEGTTLVASTTVPTEVASFFEKRWFYHRAFLSSSALLNGDIIPLPGCSPLVANAAFAVMATVGFKEIYLMGVDCGRREDAGHHAEDAIYYDEEYDNYLPGESFELLENEFTREVPGNFGGKALTTWYLDMSRGAFSTMLRLVPGVSLFNCSDGARIDGAQPRHAASIKVTSTPEQVAKAKEVVESQLLSFEAGAFLDTLDLGNVVEGCADFPAVLEESLDAALEEDEGFFELEMRMRNLLEGTDPKYLGVRAIMGGTAASLIRLGAFGGTRIADADERRAFIRFFVAQYRDVCLWMAEKTEGLLREIAERKPELTEVGDREIS